MVTQFNVRSRSEPKFLAKVFWTGLGLVMGGILTLIALWLWFDYQTNANYSYLAVMSSQLVELIPPSMRDFIAAQTQLMGLPLASETPAYWYMARIGGIVGYGLLWLSTVWGLLLSTKITVKIISPAIAFGLHEFLSILTILFLLIHAFVLLGDKYISFNIFHLLIPFTSPYEPLWTGLGIIGLYLIMLMTGSFYVRKIIGQKTWRALHYFTFLGYILALTHGLMTGTDSALLLVKLMYAGTGLGVLFLLFYRFATARVK
jgi:predicted ferric reductase